MALFLSEREKDSHPSGWDEAAEQLDPSPVGVSQNGPVRVGDSALRYRLRHAVA